MSLYQLNSSEAIKLSKGERFIVVAVRPYDIQLQPSEPFPPPLLHVMDCASVLLQEAERTGQLRRLGRGKPPSCDDLMLAFLNRHELAEFGGLRDLAFANGFVCGSKRLRTLSGTWVSPPSTRARV